MATTNFPTVFVATTPGAGTFVVPAGVTLISMEAWGGGDAGCGGFSNFAPGGGGGGYGLDTRAVTPGQTIYYFVGAGGVGSTGLGTNGQDSWVNPSANSEPVSTPGCQGQGGLVDIAGNGTNGGVGGGGIGAQVFSGGNGAAGRGLGINIGGGGGGSGGSLGAGGTAATPTGTAPNSSAPGGAAGIPDGGAGSAGTQSFSVPAANGGAPGGGGGGSWNNPNAGSGGNGQIRITYSTLTFGQNGSTAPTYGGPTDPHGIYSTTANKTFFAWEGAIAPQSTRAVYVRAFDHARLQFGPVVFVANNPLVNDDHGNPAICIDNLGYLHIFHGPHAGVGGVQHLLHEKSNSPLDESAWTSQAAIGAGLGLTYPGPMVVGNVIWLFIRQTTPIGNPVDNPLVYFKGTVGALGAVTWTGPTTIIDVGFTSRIYYQSPFVQNTTEIHMLITRAGGLDFWRRDTYYIIFDTLTKNIINKDRSVTVTPGSQPLNVFTLDSFLVIASSFATGNTEAVLCIDAKGNAHIIWEEMGWTSRQTTAPTQVTVYEVFSGPLPPLAATSYNYLFGKGVRTVLNPTTLATPTTVGQGSINIRSPFTFSSAAGVVQSPFQLVDGSYANDLKISTNASSGYFCFDFGRKRQVVIDRFKWYQSALAAQGTWTLRGSNTPSGATGDRLGQINVTSNITVATSFSSDGALYYLVDGLGVQQSTTGQGGIEFGFIITGGQSNAFFQFDFGVGASKVINGFTWYQDSAVTHGTFSFQGSNDNSSWTDIATGLNLGGAALVDAHSFSNTTGYRYYRLNQTGGTTSGSPLVYEIDFSISEVAGTPSYEPSQVWTNLLTGIALGTNISGGVEEWVFTNTTGYRFYELTMTAGTTTNTVFLNEIEFSTAIVPGPIWSAPVQLLPSFTGFADWHIVNASDGGVTAFGQNALFAPSDTALDALGNIITLHRPAGASTNWGSSTQIQTAGRFGVDVTGFIYNSEQQTPPYLWSITFDETALISSNDTDPSNGVDQLWGYGEFGYVFSGMVLPVPPPVFPVPIPIPAGNDFIDYIFQFNDQWSFLRDPILNQLRIQGFNAVSLLIYNPVEALQGTTPAVGNALVSLPQLAQSTVALPGYWGMITIKGGILPLLEAHSNIQIINDRTLMFGQKPSVLFSNVDVSHINIIINSFGVYVRDGLQSAIITLEDGLTPLTLEDAISPLTLEGQA